MYQILCCAFYDHLLSSALVLDFALMLQEDTISINHNWFNAYNLSWVVSKESTYVWPFIFKFLFILFFPCSYQWGLLLRDYNVAKEYIEDIRDICDDFEGLCQRNLAANTGKA